MSRVSGALSARVADGFRAAFGREPQVMAFAPGRVNLIGEHTDYNDGSVLPCALPLGTVVAASPRADREVVVRALDLGGAADVFSLDTPVTPAPRGHWANHPRGLVAAWIEAGLPLPGLDIAVGGDLPRGAGLSSSASLGVALATAFARMVGTDPGPLAAARMTQRAEHRFVGCACGIMDPLVAAAGREGAALLIDCRSLAWREVAVPDDVALLVVHSGVSRELADGAYNARRAECARAARAFGASSLRDVGLDDLADAPVGLDATALRRARHVVTENARVESFAGALARGDLAAAGVALRASHASLRDDFEVSHPAVDALVAALDAAVGAEGGARITGGGFGGCVIALCPQAMAGAVRAAAERHLHAAGIPEPLTLDVRPSRGGCIIAP